jgi:ATP phosphoribosyltransferase regulatory subunit
VNSRTPLEVALPRGVSDYLPEQAARICRIEEKLLHTFDLWGFRRIITPLLEFDDIMAAGVGEELKGKTFRFDDRQTGRLLAVPPDITPQVARMVATRMKGIPLPHRLSYAGRVLRHAESGSGRSRELFQVGVELMGLDSPEADAEMAAMAVQALKELGFKRFSIDLGQVEFFRGIMAASGLPAEACAALQAAVGRKDASAVADLVKDFPLSPESAREIAALPRLFGGREVLDAAHLVVTNERSCRALANLVEVVEILDRYGVSDYLTIDLGEIRGLDYHTGVTMEGFVTGGGSAVCSGGRYDALAGVYGFDTPATGFAFNLLALLPLLEDRPELGESAKRDFLIFNRKDDRGDALEIARYLREQDFSVARDIIRRDLESSLEYARKVGIRRVIVIGGDDLPADQVRILDVAQGGAVQVAKEALLQGKFPVMA